MSFRQWLDEKDSTLIRCTIEDEWTWEEFHEAMAEVRTLVYDTDQRTDLIIDLSDAGPLPMSAASIQLKNMLDRMPDHFGAVFLTTPDTFTRMIVESLDRVLPEAKGRLYVAESVNFAKRMILLLRGAQFDDGLDAATRPVIPTLSQSDEVGEDTAKTTG
jgi:hypothetical protein